MTNYQVVWDKNRIKFEQKILDLLKDGWKFRGDLIVTPAYDHDKKQIVYSWSREMEKDDTKKSD